MNVASDIGRAGEERSGPLVDVTVVELAGMGPGPHAAMVLADLGAEVLRVHRPGHVGSGAGLRGRQLVAADLKNTDDLDRVRQLIDRADVLIEGFRPGVTERLGLGPDECCRRNPGLIYTRVTGWGQTGPRAQQAGHDINYIGLTGLLYAMGNPGLPPVPPLNLVGDYGGGSMFAVLGVLAALIERQGSGRGQVIDAAIVNGAPVLGHVLWSMLGDGRWSDQRGTNIFDGSAPFYCTYECADGGYVAVGALEPEFFGEMLRLLEIDPGTLGAQRDKAGWPEMRRVLAETFRQRSRDEWSRVFADSDACVTPVLTVVEAADDAQLQARNVFVEVDGVRQPAPAPLFSRTPALRPVPARDGSLTPTSRPPSR
ncbi:MULTISPECIES: CaiB/BaiF CoA transferase family protein [Mycolicibacterium]|jgi:alpha-methylacyl-CoA racemase|uniref:CaiB/BaiF CoA-transferase family protein n=4 Tax=Mycolicibacterium TaxID=1866885 RepID=A0AAE4VDY2_MYCFO|nr:MULTISPECIES: CaiB/BaiF CoA-transferase family protein [Mycolicibacterium]MCV7142491.1 CoA transferase [Mycolicibacterium fortuitum]MDV7193411.1 CaiB/BaiF CoA-transferase family protein [Mycolicibacterium fortuitum]MDV7206820.1 CaiB/BaiF CoA-transferase family protein [Mycolicibacterium fortuitum]MDV7228338.1 CaiB/BaiF CoA-transferase family protein [Mycolicibacterium fortuitum]MDV7260446.1 CaiB/BaiF CoA-transferase family protein [Mycolicibacterium fortuitum]